MAKFCDKTILHNPSSFDDISTQPIPGEKPEQTIYSIQQDFQPTNSVKKKIIASSFFPPCLTFFSRTSDDNINIIFFFYRLAG